MLSVAVVGAGNRGATHLDTIARLGDLYRLVGVCDVREERRAWATARYAVPAFDHPLALLDRVRPDVLAVVVPPDAHHLVTAVAAARGCHVLSETPVATTLAMADDMIARCRRAGVVLEVAENVWRYPQERLKRRAVQAGLIGTVQQVHLWYRSGSYHGTCALRRFVGGPPRRALGVSRPFRVAPYRDLDGTERREQTWELGVIDFAGGQTAVYQWPVGSDRGNLWEVVGDAGALMGPDLVLFDQAGGRGPDGARRRLPVETVSEPGPDGRPVLVALRWDAGGGRPPVVWENPYRRYGAGGTDDVARADVYAGLHEAITGRPGAAGAGGPGGQGAGGVGAPEGSEGPRGWEGGQEPGEAREPDGAGERARPVPGGLGAWPESPPAGARFYGAPNARADQALLVAVRESARRGGVWLDLPLPAGAATPFEDLLHAEFERAYGAPPFADPEALLGRLFPRRGLVQTLH